MRSTLDILTTVFAIVNPIINPLITGSVYIGPSPDGDISENVTLRTLTNPATYLQRGLMNVNIELMEFKKGQANTARFDELLKVIIPLLHKADMSKADGTSVQLTIEDDKGIFPDNDQEGKYIYNLRVAFAVL